MDTDSLNAQRREAEAQRQRSQNTAATARSQLVQRQSEKVAAQAVVRQREAELGVAKKRWARSSTSALYWLIAVKFFRSITSSRS